MVQVFFAYALTKTVLYSLIFVFMFFFGFDVFLGMFIVESQVISNRILIINFESRISNHITNNHKAGHVTKIY